MKKLLVLGIIALFIGIAVAPSVTSIEFSKNKTSNDNLVEINFQLFKTSGVEDHKMFITREQNEQLELLIERFKADLDKAETREETIEIYKDMVVSLDEIGILPESNSCKEVKELVTGENSVSNPGNLKSNKYFNLAYNKLKNKNSKHSGEENRYCLIAGKTTNTETYGEGAILFAKLGGFLLLGGLAIYEVFEKYNLSVLGFLIYSLFALPACFLLITSFLSYFFPLKFGGNIFFGLSSGQDPNNIVDHPAKGWVYTNGLNGIKTWTKTIYGQISKKARWPLLCLYLGAVGFTGIKIFRPFSFGFYLGTALRVKLGSEVPL